MARRDRQRKRIILLIAFIAVIGVGGVAAVQIKNVREANLVQSRRESGLAAHEAGEHEKAIRDLGYVINKRREDGEAALAFAQSRRQVPSVNNQHLQQSAIAARRAANAMPEDVRSRELLMSLYSEMGRLTERLDTAREILAVEPQHRPALMVEIDSLRLLGRRDEAYQRALTYHDMFPGEADAIRAVLDLMLATRQPEEAVVAFVQEASVDAPEDVRVHLLKARILAVYGNLEEARDAALAAAGMDQPDAATLAETIQLLDVLGETKTVESLLDRVAATSDEGDMATVVAASRAWKDGRFTDAIGRIESTTVAIADASDALLGWTVIINPQSEKATQARAELAGRDSSEAQSWLAVIEARELVQSAEWIEAAQRARRALELFPRNEIAMFLLGETERAVADWRAAVDRWRSLKVSEPRWLTLRVDIISALLAAGQAREAYEEGVIALRDWPNRLLVAQAVGRAGVAMIERNEANANERAQLIVLLQEIAEQSSDPATGLSLLARAQAASGDATGARQTLARLLDHESLPPREDLIPLLESAQRFDIFGADELVARASGAAADDPGILLTAATAAHENGRTREAISLFDDAQTRVASNPNLLAGVKRARAIFLDRIGDSGALEALIEVAQANRTDPEAQLALLNSRAAWTNRSAVKSAISALRQASSANSTTWRVFEAREILTFDPTEKSAAQLVTALDDVIRREPENVRALTYLGEAYAILKDFSQAAVMVGRAVDLLPRNPALHARLIELLQAAGETDQAITRLRAFALLDGLSRDERRHRAQLLLRQGMNAEAQRDLAALAESGAVEDESLAAQAAARTGDVAAARQRFDRILQRDDRTVDAVVAAADFYARNVDLNRGLEVLAALPDTVSDTERELHTAAYYARHGQVVDAERLYSELAERSDHVDAWTGLAQLRLRAGDAQGAKAAVDKGLTNHPQDHDLKILQITTNSVLTGGDSETLSQMLAVLDESTIAREPLEKYIAVRKSIEGRPNDSNFAVEQLRRFIAEYPGFFLGWKDLAQLHSAAGRAAEAATVASEAAYRMPTEPRAAELAARALVLAGRFDEALPMAEEWARRVDQDPYQAQLFLGAILRRMGRPADALTRFDPWRDRIIHEAPRSPDVILAYAGLLAQQGRLDDAATLFDTLVERDNSWAIARLRVASSLVAQPANARDWLAKWAPTLPDTPDATTSLGQVYYEVATAIGDRALLNRAIEFLNAAVDHPPYRALVATLLAGAYEQTGDLAAAERFYRMALEESPDEAVVLNNLSYLLIRNGGSGSEAVELARRAVALARDQRAPQDLRVNFLDSLAAALMYIDEPAQAADAYEEAASLAPEHVGVLFGLADAHLAAGNLRRAQDAVSRLLALRDRGAIADPNQRQRLTQLIERTSTSGE